MYNVSILEATGSRGQLFDIACVCAGQGKSLSETLEISMKLNLFFEALMVIASERPECHLNTH